MMLKRTIKHNQPVRNGNKYLIYMWHLSIFLECTWHHLAQVQLIGLTLLEFNIYIYFIETYEKC